VVAPDEAERLAAMEDVALALELERRSHSLLGRLTIEGPRSFWPLAGLSAQRLAANRVALIGETAHMFPPIGAQGFNLTIRDILALADHVMGSADPGAPALLARYEAARRSDVTMRTAAVDLLNRSLLSEFLPVQLARSAGLYLLERAAPIRRQAMRQGLAPQLDR
jgi:2-octaprenyl-6-methoxyphenol hydroxylase